jgi:hypothetical protein
VSPDDPRHGTNAGYIAHALGDKNYCQPCRDAHVRKRKETRLRNLRGQYAKVDATGTVRRVQALLALGHTHPEIAAAAGGPKNISKNVILNRYDNLHADVAAAISRAYEALSMTVPTHWRARECARRAKALGYLPPLAWDDIDDPNERPRRGSDHARKDDIDPVVVARVLDGDDSLRPTQAERREIVREWRRLGRPLIELERRGWKPERYVQREEGAA